MLVRKSKDHLVMVGPQIQGAPGVGQQIYIRL